MIVVKAPAGFDPTWPAIPVDRCDIAPGQRVALAIETPCERCHGTGTAQLSTMGRKHPARCPDCDGSRVRLRVEYTAQVAAVVPIVEEVGDAPGDVVCCGEGILDFWAAAATEYTDGVPLAWPTADWSPGRVAVLISDVRAITVSRAIVFYFWKFIHNAVVHPLLAFPWEGPRFLERFHDWTAARCPGAG